MNFHGSTPRRLYNEGVDRYHFKAFAGVAAALTALLFAPAVAYAQTASFTVPVSASPVVRVQTRAGSITIRTWKQPEVQIASTDPVTVQHYESEVVDRALGAGDIPIFSTTVLTPQGPLMLPAEDFPIGSIGSGHDAVVIHAPDAQSITVTIPEQTALVWAMTGRGEIALSGYRNGTFVARVHGGRIDISNSGGNAYIEVARGPIQVRDSAFNRLRARTALGNIGFENCNARQIEVSSIDGNLAYDNGTFAPGLARFESQNGNVAIGVAGGSLQIGAHSASGKIFANLPNAHIDGTQTDAQASLGNGGPLVTASSTSGAVYLYNGRFKGQNAAPKWRRIRLQQKPPHYRHI